MTRTRLMATLVIGLALTACADRPVSEGKNSNHAPQIGTAPMAPTADGAVRVSGGVAPATTTAATLSPGTERARPPVAAAPVQAPAAATSQAPAPAAPVAVATLPPSAPAQATAVETASMPPPPVAAVAPVPMQAGTVGQSLAATVTDVPPPAPVSPPVQVVEIPPLPVPAPAPVPLPVAPAPAVQAAAPVPASTGNVVALPVDGVTMLPPPPSTSLPAVVLPPAASAPVAAQNVAAPQPPLPPVLMAVAPSALPGRDFAEQLTGFAAKASPGAVAQVNDPAQPAPTLLRLEREYFAASGRACREISGRTTTADVTYVVCQQDAGWALIPALMRSRPLAVN
ncbi:hypothetical protein ACFSM5_18380 [Lacibacterium aquatile]|uniref:Uncharacterized protein n=1 Tax=Lacibacterium aquatile TaxID=1168082 RepID=A0ABW5E0A5_9PROT